MREVFARGRRRPGDRGAAATQPAGQVVDLVVALVTAALVAVAGNEYDVLGKLNSFPRLPVDEGDLTTGGIIALGAVAR